MRRPALDPSLLAAVAGLAISLVAPPVAAATDPAARPE